MKFIDKSCKEFIAELSGKAPVPGGGGASALVGAVGTALGNMVGSLTVGKKKYAAVEDDIRALMERGNALMAELSALVDKDAEVFEPLSKAYGLPKETEEQRELKAKIMEKCLKDACSVPMEIMELSTRAIELMVEFAAKGSTLAVSDAGVGAVCCKAALQGASLNVFINTNSMTDRAYAAGLNARAEEMLEKYVPMADGVFNAVYEKLKK